VIAGRRDLSSPLTARNHCRHGLSCCRSSDLEHSLLHHVTSSLTSLIFKSRLMTHLFTVRYLWHSTYFQCLRNDTLPFRLLELICHKLLTHSPSRVLLTSHPSHHLYPVPIFSYSSPVSRGVPGQRDPGVRTPTTRKSDRRFSQIQ